MNVALLADSGNIDGTLGGAELTMREFAAAAPDDVTLVGLEDADAVIVGNCVSFGLGLIELLDGKRAVKYWNDVGPHVHPSVKSWLRENAVEVYCSPLQARYMGDLDGVCIPPPIDLDRFRNDEELIERRGAVALGSWHNPGKGQVLLREWADANEPVDVWGSGPFLPNTPSLILKGQVAYEDVPEVLAGYRTFVHLPTSPEPFGRGVVEAWSAGLDLVVNRLVGAIYWIDEAPEKLETAAEDLWDLVTAQVTA